MGEFLKGYLHVKCAGQSRLARKASEKIFVEMSEPFPEQSDLPTTLSTYLLFS
jgi:hypothetical protein